MICESFEFQELTHKATVEGNDEAGVFSGPARLIRNRPTVNDRMKRLINVSGHSGGIAAFVEVEVTR